MHIVVHGKRVSVLRVICARMFCHSQPLTTYNTFQTAIGMNVVSHPVGVSLAIWCIKRFFKKAQLHSCIQYLQINSFEV